MQKNILLLLLLSLVFVARAQQNFMPGYIVTAGSTDTIRGYIHNEAWINSPNAVQFQAAVNAPPETYKPTDLAAFAVDGELYRAAILEVETSSRNDKSLSKSQELRFRTDTVFLRTLVDGPKSLFLHHDKNNDKHFYIADEDQFKLLVYKKYLNPNYGREIRVLEHYKGALKTYLNDCPDLKNKITALKYSTANLKKVFLQYYECVPETPSYVSEDNKRNLNVGFSAIAGISASNLNYTAASYLGYYQTILAQSDFQTSYQFTAGLSMDVTLPGNLKRISFHNHLFLMRANMIGYGRYFNREDDYMEISYRISNTYLRMHNILRYNYPLPNYTLFINGGLATGYSLGETNEATRKTVMLTRETLENEIGINGMKRGEVGYVAGAGIRKNRFSYELRYEAGNGNAKSRFYGSETNRYYFLVGYNF